MRATTTSAKRGRRLVGIGLASVLVLSILRSRRGRRSHARLDSRLRHGQRRAAARLGCVVHVGVCRQEGRVLRVVAQ